MNNNQKKEFQIFFIASHLSIYENIKYELSKDTDITSNLLERFCTKINNEENNEFKVTIISYSFNESKKTEMKHEIKLIGYGSEQFLGTINFKPNRNTFIYDFSFDICQKYDEDISPPESLRLTKYEQFNIFRELIKQDQLLKKDESLLESLLIDSFFFLKDDKQYYYIDFYLSLLVNCYTIILPIVH